MTGTSEPVERRALAAALLITVAYAVIGFWLLDPEALFSIDAGVKLLQADSLRNSSWSSIAIPYPAQSIDPHREHLPFMLPFVFERAQVLHGMYPLAVAWLYAVALSAGVKGTVWVSVLSTFAVLLALIRIAGRLAMTTVLLLGVCTFFWAYGVLMWEHMPALACSTWAWLALRGPRPGVLLAGVLLGLATALRPETILLVPGLAFMYRDSLTAGGALRFVLGLVLPVATIGGFDALLYGRTPFVHVMHAVDVVWRTVGTAAPVARPDSIPLGQQAGIVLGDWVVGLPGALPGLGLLGLLVAAHLCRPSVRELSVTVLMVASIALAIRDVIVTASTPDLLAGLLRGAPCVLLALLPLAPGRGGSATRTRALVAVAIFVGGLFVTRQYGGVQIGPRFLVPLLPLLAVMTAEWFDSYRAAHANERTAGLRMLAAGLVLVSVALQVVANFRTVRLINDEGSRLLAFVRQSSAPLVVISDLFLINHVATEYERTLVVRAVGELEVSEVSRLAASARVRSIVTVDRVAPGSGRAVLRGFRPERAVYTPHAKATLWLPDATAEVANFPRR
jgi:hypothetical protein